MMRVLTAASIAASLATGVAAQEARPEVAVVVVTLDEARQGQIKHGRTVLAAVGDERFGRLRLVEPTIALTDFSQCEDESPRYGLSFCARYTLQAGLEAGSGPHVVIVFDDRAEGAPSVHGGEEMRVLCFGRGAEPADAAAQDTWLWPNSARIHGVSHWERDQDALAGCITAALSEPPGEPKPGW